MVHETRERCATDIAALIALARNPLRLVHGAHPHAGSPSKESAPLPLQRALWRRVRLAFLRAGTPTSVPGAESETADQPPARPAGSLLRRME
jgi:hypothetical protein